MKKAPLDIRQAVEQSFKQLISEKSYRSVSVSDIAEIAHISRHSFYEYYANKEEVVSSIFSQDVIKPLSDVHAAFTLSERQNIPEISEMLLRKMYQAVFNNGEFYGCLVKPMKGHDDTFLRIATNAIYDFNKELLESVTPADPEETKDYSAYIFASSQAMLMQKWIASDFDLTVEEITSLYNRIMTPFWLDITN